MLRNILTALLCTLFAVAGLNAQTSVDNFHFTHFKSADGLPHQQIQAMAFDPDGRLWVGTRNGLASYDGYSFTTYYHRPGDSRSLPHNFVLCMIVDSHGRLWVGTEKGLCRYVPETDDFEQASVDDRRIFFLCETREGHILCSGAKIHLAEKGSLEFRHKPRQKENSVRGMAVSADNRIYVATDDAVTAYDSRIESGTQVNLAQYSNSPTATDGLAPLIFDSQGRMWVGLNGRGVMCADKQRGISAIYDTSRLTSGTVRTIAEDKRGNIWLGTERGINIINPETGAVSQITQDLVNPTKLNDNAIYCILPDNSGNIWIGTYFGGINLLVNNYNKFAWTTPGYDRSSLRGKAIRRIVEPAPRQLWLASEDGGINIMDIATGNISSFDRIPGLGPNVHELYFDSARGDMWIGTFLNGLYRHNLSSGATRRYLTADGLPSNSIFTIARQKGAGAADEQLWIGTTGGLRYYDRASDTFQKIDHTVLSTDFIYALLVDRAQNLWVGTVNSGLYRIDRRTGEITGWNQCDGPDASGFKDHYITALLEDSAGRVFVGTNNGGLYFFQPGNLKNVRALGNCGSDFGTVCALTADRHGKVWMSTSNGLFCIDPSSLRFQQYTVADGLPENQFNFNSALEASNGRMYFGTVNGLVSFFPQIRKHSGTQHKVHFSSLSVNGDEAIPNAEGSPLELSLDRIDELHLDYEESRQFSILFGVVDPQRASSTLYQMKVDGIDPQWRDLGHERRFTGMDIPPGTYTLHVRASDNPDDWNSAPVRSLRIVVAPPFYRSWWAYLLYLLLIAGAVYLVYRLFNLRMREKQEMRLAQLDKAKDEGLRKEKMEFFTNISHELKTPLSLILAPLKYIEHNQSLTPESRKRLDLAIANTNKMVGLIDELVTFNRVENGNFKLYLQKGNPLTYIEKLAQFFYATAEERGISLRISVENNGEDIWFSSTYVERIVNNLLSNAIKYTPAGGEVALHAAIVERPSNVAGEPDQIYLDIEVRDTGIGIPPEEIDSIFQKYYQTRQAINHSNHGWGIGLATVKKLVETNRGSIAVESTVGKGSVFSVSLLATPGAFPQSAYMTNASSPVAVPSYRSSVADGLQPQVMPEYARPDDRTTILLVEDNPQLLTFLTETFSRSYRVLTATNGAEALKITASDNVDIVVSDVMMPEMDGIELCNRLKNNLETSHIPVILLTAKTDEPSTVAGYESGAEAYVYKPFDPQILALRIKNILRARRHFISSIIDSSPSTPHLPSSNPAASPSPIPNSPSGDGAGGDVAGAMAPSADVHESHAAGAQFSADSAETNTPCPSPLPTDTAEFMEYPAEETPNLTKFDKEFLERINALVEANIDNSQFSIADITREMGVSRSLLHIKMKSFTSASMTDYIRKRRLARACELLRQGYNVSETAYRTGYSDPNYFTKVFKKEFSCTPTDFISAP